MSGYDTTREFNAKLQEALGLGEFKVRNITLRVGVGEVPTAKVELLVSDEAQEKIAAALPNFPEVWEQ